MCLAHLSRRLIHVGEHGPAYVRRCRPSTTMLKDHLQNRLANQSQILCGASWEGGTKVCSRHLGHMTKMATTPLYVLCFTRPRYQVSVYRTIGPLVLLFLYINYLLCWKWRRENSHSFVYILIDTLLGRILIFVTTSTTC